MFDAETTGKNIGSTLNRSYRLQSTNQHTVILPNVLNPIGGKIFPPKKGARGISGLRADIRDGRVTIAQLAAMPLRVLTDRYGWSSDGSAGYARKQILAYGLGGRMRDEHGKPRR